MTMQEELQAVEAAWIYRGQERNRANYAYGNSRRKLQDDMIACDTRRIKAVKSKLAEYGVPENIDTLGQLEAALVIIEQLKGQSNGVN